MSTAAQNFTVDKNLFNRAVYKQLREIWFDGIPDGAKEAPKSVQARWFGQGASEESKAFDVVCTKGFRAALESVGPEFFPLPPATTYQAEREHAEDIAAPFLAHTVPDAEVTEEEAAANALSLVLLFDQMSRNIFRKSIEHKLIYSQYDRIARALVHNFLGRASRPDFVPKFKDSRVYRMWWTMPLLHSEYMEDHNLCDEKLQEIFKLAEEKGHEELKKFAELIFGFEKMHVDIIKEFGRYPYRNKALGREYTEEELAWEAKGGAFFATKSSDEDPTQ